ncbi:MAG: hypothetical protein FWH32_06470 [Clostridiales bacterium]|nr:hypothetical protein [Clostridiales bacterium]
MKPEIRYKGAGLLKVISIVIMIFGAITIAIGAISMASGSAMASLLGLDELAVQFFVVIGTISMVSGIVMLVCGFFGYRLRNKGEKAGFLILLGIVQIIVAAFSVIYSNIISSAGEIMAEQILDNVGVVGGVGTTDNIVFTVIGFVLPALYIVGALMNKVFQPKMVH